jgi:DNA helicase-2/ATP-dependent DNA helicase PcrA
MEFRHVYLVGMAEDQLPSFQAKKAGDDSREMQEERRNCFVAITRTMESLTLTYADKYNGWQKNPSRFLTEMGFSVDESL